MSRSIQQLRKYRIYGITLFDFILAFIVLSVLFLIAWRYHFPKLHWWVFVLAAAYAVFPVTMIAYIFFGINTESNYMIGLCHKPSS
jgi:hypothetical protein